MTKYTDLQPGRRILMGPGPSDVDPRVLRAMAAPLVGHLDPAFLRILDEVGELLRLVFQTENKMTVAMPGTGSAGMETCFANLIEPGDRVVIGVNGLFGERMCDVAARCGAEAVRVEAPWGEPLDPEKLAEAVERHKPKALAVVHAETSTGVLQPMTAIGQIAREYGVLLVADCVTSLGGAPVEVDRWGVDAAYSGTQKCLSCPPGLAPVTFSQRAMQALRERRSPVQSWYLDLTMIGAYWGSERTYHHTAPISMIYALREALRLIAEEGLAERVSRHARLSGALAAGLEALGLELLVAHPFRAPMLLTVKVPAGIDEARVRRRLLEEAEIEIGGGLGPLKGKIWRIGLMGSSCRRSHVEQLLAALGRILAEEGGGLRAGGGVDAALSAAAGALAGAGRAAGLA